MIFKSGWSKQEIESLTYEELFRYVEQYYRIQATELFDFFKAFCVYNAESSTVAFNTKQGTLNRYVNEVKERTLDLKKENDIDDLFKEIDFGK